CVADGESVEIESTERPAGNALSPADFGLANLQPGRLDQTLQSMASTQAGRMVLPYVIGCALSGGTVVNTTYWNGIGNVPISFTGEIGLVPSWTTTNPTQSQQRLISACVLARVN